MLTPQQKCFGARKPHINKTKWGQVFLEKRSCCCASNGDLYEVNGSKGFNKTKLNHGEKSLMSISNVKFLLKLGWNHLKGMDPKKCRVLFWCWSFYPRFSKGPSIRVALVCLLCSSLALAKASLQEAFLEASGKIQDETHRAKALGLLDGLVWMDLFVGCWVKWKYWGGMYEDCCQCVFCCLFFFF